MRSRTAASNWRGITGSISPMDTARIRSGSTAVTARRTRSAIRRFECECSRLDAGLALAGCDRERPLPWRQPGHGVAARRFGWVDGKKPAGTLINANLGMAVLVAIVHAAAMIAAGGCCAWLAYRYLGLKFISQSWFNLDTIWAVSLVVVGAIALVLNLS